jgi:hypothetical protein
MPHVFHLPASYVHGYPGRGGGSYDGHGGAGTGSSGRPPGIAPGGGAAPYPEYFDRIDSESPVVRVVAVPAVHGGYWLVDPGD